MQPCCANLSKSLHQSLVSVDTDKTKVLKRKRQSPRCIMLSTKDGKSLRVSESDFTKMSPLFADMLKRSQSDDKRLAKSLLPTRDSTTELPSKLPTELPTVDT